MKYTVSIRPSAQKAISKIEKKTAQKIVERIDLLATDPRHHGSIKLIVGSLADSLKPRLEPVMASPFSEGI